MDIIIIIIIIIISIYKYPIILPSLYHNILNIYIIIISYESYGQQPSGRRLERPAGPAAATAPSASPAPPTVYGKALGSQVGYTWKLRGSGSNHVLNETERMRDVDFTQEKWQKLPKQAEIAIY
jgi:hypothetical protein